MDKLKFIIIHHSSCELHTKLLFNCIMSIREFYKFNRIMIIKTSKSNIPNCILDEDIYVYNKTDDDTFVIGAIPIILDILNDNDKFILIHDSMFLIKDLPINILSNDIYTLWDFESDFNFSITEFNILSEILNISHPKILNELYMTKYSKLWRGCFGPAFGGSVIFLKKIESILNLERNMDYFRGRPKLLLSERIIPLLIEYIRITENNLIKQNPILCLNKSIYDHPDGFKYTDMILLNDIKNKAKVYNYKSYFYKLWYSRM
jgi:hypothetical protein